MLDYKMWGLSPCGYHAINIALHLLNTILVFRLAEFLTRNSRAAFLGSLFFLVHPAHTQAVTYISGRADLFAAFFILSAILLFIKGKHNCHAVILFIFALLSKESALVFPLLLLFCEAFLYNRPKNFKLYAYLLFVIALYLIFRQSLLPFSGEETLPQGIFIRAINLPKLILFYLSLLFFPHNLRIERSILLSNSPDLPLALYWLVLIAAAIWIFKKRQNKVLIFCLFWFLFNLLPALNLILPLNAVVAEHWLYLSSAGVFILLGSSIDNALSGRANNFISKFSYKFKLTVASVAVCALGLVTVARNFEWKNSLVLFEATLKASKNANGRVRFNLGNAYLSRGLYDRAIAEFKEALKVLTPGRCKAAHYQLGLAYLAKTLYPQAEEELLEAIEADPGYLPAYYTLARLYEKEAHPDKAREVLNKALKIKPQHPSDEVIAKEIMRLAAKF